MVYRLVILSGPYAGQQITVEKTSTTIGSGPDCTIRIPDDEMANRHAVLEHTDKGLVIRDLGTMHKILVNHRQTDEYRLKHGDEFEIGRTRILLQATVRAEVDAAGRPAGSDMGHPGKKRRGTFLLAALVVIAAFSIWRYYLRSSDGVRPGEAWTAQVGEATNTEAQVYNDDSRFLFPVTSSVPTGASSSVVVATNPPQPDGPSAVPQPQPPVRVKTNAVPTNAVPPAPTNAVQVPPAVPTAEEKQAKIDKTMADARAAAAADDTARAHRLLAGLVEFAPEYWQAYEMRASLYERENKPNTAAKLWRELLEKCKDRQWREKAQRECARLAGAGRAPVVHAGPVARIVSVEPTKFPGTDSYEEMRTLAVTLRQEAGVDIDPGSVSVEVTFYDSVSERNPERTSIRPSKMIVPKAPLVVDGRWSPGEQKVVTASYVVPRAGAQTGRAQYHGYTVRLLYAGRIQDQACSPAGLLSQLRSGGPAGGR